MCISGGVLAVLALGFLTFVFVLDKPGSDGLERWRRTHTEMGEIRKALILYAIEHEHFPESLELLREDFFPNGVPEGRFTKRPYIYATGEQGFVLISYGHNEAPGGPEPNDRDIVYTEHGCLTDWQ